MKIKAAFYIFLIQLTSAQRNFHIVPTSLSCVPQAPDLFKNYSCYLVERNGNIYQGGIMVLYKPLAELNMHVTIEVFTANKGKWTWIDMPIDGCAFLEVTQKMKVLSRTYNSVKRFINFMPKCPLRANVAYIIKDFVFDTNDLPSYVPECDYRFTLVLLKSDRLLLKLLAQGKVLQNRSKAVQRRKRT